MFARDFLLCYVLSFVCTWKKIWHLISNISHQIAYYSLPKLSQLLKIYWVDTGLPCYSLGRCNQIYRASYTPLCVNLEQMIG